MQIFQVFIFLFCFYLCFKRSKISNEEEKKNFELRFKVLFDELKENTFPLYYFLFFIRRLTLVIIVNLITNSIIRLTLSAILSLAVIEI